MLPGIVHGRPDPGGVLRQSTIDPLLMHQAEVCHELLLLPVPEGGPMADPPRLEGVHFHEAGVLRGQELGIRQLQTKLLAFAVSSFFCGVAGALYAYAYLGTVEPEAYSLDLSFRILFMVMIGGLGSILGSFLGAGFIVLLPIVLNYLAHMLRISTAVASNVELMLFGAMIIFFLIVEPLGLARLWQIAKEKLRLWPFPH